MNKENKMMRNAAALFALIMALGSAPAWAEEAA